MVSMLQQMHNSWSFKRGYLVRACAIRHQLKLVILKWKPAFFEQPGISANWLTLDPLLLEALVAAEKG